MRNQQTNEGSVKQSSAPSTDGLLIRASFLGSYLSKQFDRIDKEGFKAENDVPVIEEFLNQMIRTWVDYMEENGIEIQYPYINDVSMKQSSTSSTEIKDRLFGELGDTSYGDFLEVKSAIEEGKLPFYIPYWMPIKSLKQYMKYGLSKISKSCDRYGIVV
jgi:hypothetical protein